MKGNISLMVVFAILTAMTAIAMYGMFRFSMIPKVDSWRLTRVAMLQAHLMASEFRQDDVGIVKNLDLPPIKSRGYTVFYKVIEAEPPYELPRDGYGYFEDLPTIGGAVGSFVSDTVSLFDKDPESDEGPLPRGYSYYTLPIVYGPENKFGYLSVVITRDLEDEEWAQSTFERSLEMLKEVTR